MTDFDITIRVNQSVLQLLAINFLIFCSFFATLELLFISFNLFSIFHFAALQHSSSVEKLWDQQIFTDYFNSIFLDLH